MALPFTSRQRDEIRARLLMSARRHALITGLKKTSLDMLTADAGISKSSFYKFYESKEQLFLEAARLWEEEILRSARLALKETEGESNKARAAAMVFAAFKRVHELGLARFMREDMPLLEQFFAKGAMREHMLSSAQSIFVSLKEANIRFTAPDETVSSVIQLMYLSILHIGAIGDSFFPALQELVAGACDRLVV